MKITCKITRVLPTLEGTSKAGQDWKKLSFIAETTEEYNNLYCFDVFGEEKVDNFLKYNKVGQDVDVEFNIKTNEWKEKFYTSLDAWKIFKADTTANPGSAPVASPKPEEDHDDLPF